MPAGRFVQKSLSRSHPFHQLPSDQCRLAFVMTIPHLDIEGRITGEPDELRAIVMPFFKGITANRFEKHIVSWCEMRNPDTNRPVVLRYCVHGVRYLQFVNFKENQPHLRTDRECPSIIPPPPAGFDSGSNSGIDSGSNSGVTPDLSLPSSLPSTLPSTTPLPPQGESGGGSDSAMPEIIDRAKVRQYFRDMSNGGNIDHVSTQLLEEMADEFGDPEAYEALKIAALAGKRGSNSLSFIRGTLIRRRNERENTTGQSIPAPEPEPVDPSDPAYEFKTGDYEPVQVKAGAGFPWPCDGTVWIDGRVAREISGWNTPFFARDQYEHWPGRFTPAEAIA